MKLISKFKFETSIYGRFSKGILHGEIIIYDLPIRTKLNVSSVSPLQFADDRERYREKTLHNFKIHCFFRQVMEE